MKKNQHFLVKICVFLRNTGLTITIYDVIFSSMMFLRYPINDENLSLIYSGLNSISGKGREHLKNIAKSLIDLQNHSGTPMPDSICREIVRDSMNELLREQ